MVAVTLPDGSVRRFESPVTGSEVAASIGAGLAKAALAWEVDGVERDLSFRLEADARISILTPTTPQGLEIIRHDAAHLMAEAVKELFPETQVTIGPAIENGFYYDFARETPFTPDDLTAIETKMREISARNEPITREEWDRDEAVRFFESQGEQYKAEIIRDIPAGQVISLYRQGNFIDLCRGPHAPSTGHVKAFKLMKLAGAYWRGDSRNPMLQRIYGTAWATEKELQAYLHQLEEAEKRDHRKLGPALGLFHIQEEAVGQVFWHDKGWTLYRTVEDYIRRRIQACDYQEVKTPILVDRALWEASGHWDKFRQNMFTAESEERILALKPMNCPCHIQIFKQGTVSYRDLPLRMAEFGSCHRNEPSGALHGLMRVRGFTQDDAHIFCMESQITEETIAFCDLLRSVYQDFGFTEIMVKFSDRPEVRAGTDATWDKAETALKEAVSAAGLPTTLNPGEGAFYGPKLEFVLRDALGRDWQCGTLQVDFVLPERLGATYIGSDGAKHHPVMLHRAILGSLERFIGILIEQHAGTFPVWLAPVQVAVLTITNEIDTYGAEVLAALKAAGIRAILDTSSEKIGYKIRHHVHQRIPVMLALGKKEMEQKTVSIRRLGSEQQDSMTLTQAVQHIAELATQIDEAPPVQPERIVA
jgi:threonyl-tRNA synthetase